MKSVLFTLLVLASTLASAQTKDSVTQIIHVVPQEEIYEPRDEDYVYIVVEQSPEYPGGMAKLMEFIKANLKYPANAEAGVEGKVFVAFVVEKDGSLSGITTVKSLGAEFDKEAERVIGILPKWNPGKQNGKVVRAKFVIPVGFKGIQPEKK